ncbi:MAG: FIST C-terminal domain-containing protein [Chloroflexi bacterium]|nr:FIST C-terminal domain-containing protein [Chloroflexota bacterium]
MVQAGVGQASDLDGRAAAAQAAYAALTGLGGQPAAGLVFASHEYDVQQVMLGLGTHLANTPLFGMSTAGEFGPLGVQRRAVAVALLAGEGVEATAGWVGGFGEHSRQAVEQVSLMLGLGANSEGALLLAGDGLSSDGEGASAALPPGVYALAGALAGGDVRRGRTFQIGGTQAGYTGVAALHLSGGLTAGVGVAHGWQPVGAYFKVTGARGAWVRMLDGRPASEAYSTLFGRPAREWSFPPLSALVRLYPLGLEGEEGADLLVRTPLQVEPDGSLRMNASVPESAIGHLLVGSLERCIEAAGEAARTAVGALGGAAPRLALVLADVAWEMLFKGRPGADLAAVRAALGPDVPVVGGYTLGQFAKPNGGRPQFLNQQMVVLALGDKAGE